MIMPASLEKWQVAFYLLAVFAGLAFGQMAPEAAAVFSPLVWLLLALLLYTTFLQTPLTDIGHAFGGRRFMLYAVVGNFLFIPVLVVGLAALAPVDPAIRLGIVLVLLVPCTDWFVSFSRLGGGDASRALAFTPVSLLLQMLLLPLYLSVYVLAFTGLEFAAPMLRKELMLVFVLIIVLPLCVAVATQMMNVRWRAARQLIDTSAWAPVPLLALVVFVIVASQVNTVLASMGELARVALIFLVFAVLAALLARVMAGGGRLPASEGRVLAFSFSTRNSFVVLPLALALPAGFELTATVIVLQSLVELLLMIFYLWWIPRRLFPYTDRP